MRCLLSFLAFLSSLAIGVFLFLKPSLAIELQKRFYEKINWRIEPVSVPKEIRNTKIMGLFLVILSLIILIVQLKPNPLSPLGRGPG